MVRELEDCECSPEYVSGVYLSEKSTVPRDIIEFDHSFGYNCKKLFNLVLITDDVLVFSSGNYIHYFHISTCEIEYRRSAGGGGIGFILKNPNPEYNYLTICENGTEPLIMIYDYPSNDVIAALEDGATRSFTCANYRPDGELLASQSGEPEYMITIWNWKASQIILRCQSYQNDVTNVIFSPYNPILLTTCGLGHIKFWKMARSFTGLKLQGELGRFGKTEISDINVIFMLPDEKVISGCEWGNMLLWDAGLIKLEVCRKNRKPCHGGPITFFRMDEGELMTAGIDGYVRIWFWDTVELADPPDDDRFVEIEPIYEFRIGNSNYLAEIRHLVKVKPKDPEDCSYYVQDGNGGIWLCWLDKNNVPETPRLIYSTHGGRVMAGDASPISTHFVTIGICNKLHVYNYKEKSLQFSKQFKAFGTDLIWIPTQLDSSGSVIIIGFQDGAIRQFVLEFDSNLNTVNGMHLLQVVKPHNKAITKISVNLNRKLLVSSAEDNTIFVLQITKEPDEYIKLTPIGFINLTSTPTALCWHDNDINLLIGSNIGEIFEVDLPDRPGNTEITYCLSNVTLKKVRFKSIKSEIRRNIRLEIKENKKREQRAKKLAELMKLKETNPGMEIDENMIRDDNDDEEEEPPLYIPPVPNPILWLKYTKENTVWISVAGFDAGYIYEMVFNSDKPKRSTKIEDGDDTEIYCYLYIDKYLIYATQNGILRINTINPNNFLDHSDYYMLGVHDNKIANVSKIFTSYDGKHLFTLGHDGNVFSFYWNGPHIEKPSIPKTDYIQPKLGEDIEDIIFPSLEEQKIKAEEDKKMKIRNDRKAKILNIASQYRLEFKEILSRNQALAESQQYTDEELELDKRITDDLKITLTAELDLVRRKLAFDVEKAILGKNKVMDFFIKPLEHMPFEVQGILSDTVVKSFRMKGLSIEIDEIKKEIERRILLLGESSSDDNDDVLSGIDIYEAEKSIDISLPRPPEEKFFLGLKPEDVIPKFPPKMLRLLNRYRERKLHQVQRLIDWEKMNYKKPDPHKNHIDDIRAIAEAERSIGDYKLKTDAEYEPKSSDNALNKYKELLRAREILYKKKEDFNVKLLDLRKQKKQLFELIDKQEKVIKSLHNYVPDAQKLYIPKLKDIIISKEYPENTLIELVKAGTGVEISDFFKSEKISENSSKSLINIPTEEQKPSYTLEILRTFRHFTIDISSVKSLPSNSKIEELMSAAPTYLDPSDIIKLGSTDEIAAWETEIKYQMIINKIVDQHEIVTEISCKIKKFDDDLLELGESKLQIEIDSKFLEIYLITLNQELMVLKDCEKLENKLSAKALKAMNDKNSLKGHIDGLVKSIDDIKKNCDKMNEQIKHIMTSFMSHIKGNKFFDFLKRIFKKKYRPPKEVTDDDESESESSSESSSEEEENDDKSVDTLDMTPIRLDENICPQNCERKLYDLAFQLRTERHVLEQAIHSQTKIKDEKQRELTDQRKNLAKVEQLFIQERRNLTDFRRQKQAVLNKITSVVVLQMDQLQYLTENENVNSIPNTLLFGSENVLQLYARVGQLDLETLETKRIHRINIIHLTRMNTDCKYMNRQIHLLQEEIQKAMYRKFGCQLDVDHLEEETLRHFIFQLQTNLNEERKIVMNLIADKKKRLKELEQVLNHEIQLGAEKYNILTILQEELNFLREVLNLQTKNFEKTDKKGPDFRYDIQKLRDVEKHQKEQIENLEKEIRSLRFKSKPLQVHPKEGEEPPPPDGTVEILPPDDLINDDERLFKNIESIMPVNHQFGPDVFTMDKIKKIVHTFIIKNFNKQNMPDQSVRKYIDKISKFLGYVAKNYECDDMEKVMDCIVEQFQNIIPKKYLIHVQPQQIKNLFNEIVGIFRYEKIEINVEEVIIGIVQNAYEIVQNIKPKPLNFTQALLVEVFKEMIEVLTVGDLKKPQTVSKLCELLLEYPAFIPKCIDIYNLVSDVLDYARSNLLEEFTQHPLREFADFLCKKLNSFVKAEKLLEKT